MSRSSTVRMAPPFTALVYDSFTRADSSVTLGAADTGHVWTANAGTWGISANKAYKVTTDATDAWATVDCGATDVYVSCVVTTTDTTAHQDHGLFLRSDGNSFLLATLDVADDKVRLHKKVDVNYTMLAESALPLNPSAVYKLSIAISGSVVTVDVDDVNRITHTLASGDATLFTGGTRVGIRLNAAGIYGQRFDEFTVRNVGVTPLAVGGVETTPGDGYKYHTFTSSGTLTVTRGGVVEYLVVAGGGGGGGSQTTVSGAGGGGAGGAKTGTVEITSNQTITVGAKGVGGSAGTPPTAGTGSSIGVLVTTTGGGPGGYTGGAPAAGGSGGGGWSGTGTDQPGGIGTTGEGWSGGYGQSTTGVRGGGGGGGKNGGGGVADTTKGGNGGAGIEWPAGSGSYYAGGGGGGSNGTGSSTAGTGTHGGGDGGYYSPLTDGFDATRPGSGGGGGGRNGTGSVGGDGADGIVIVRYPV